MAVIKSIVPTLDRARSIVVRDDGEIIVAGTTYTGTSDFALVRYNADMN